MEEPHKVSNFEGSQRHIFKIIYDNRPEALVQLTPKFNEGCTSHISSRLCQSSSVTMAHEAMNSQVPVIHMMLKRSYPLSAFHGRTINVWNPVTFEANIH